MLKYKLSSEDFEKLSDAEKGFYAQAGDGYQLQVEGATDKSKVDDFRAKNIELMNSAKQFENVDMDKYNAIMEQQRKLDNQELIDKKDFDTLLSNHTKNSDKVWSDKLEVSSLLASTAATQYTALLTKVEIEGAATKAFADHKINPEAFDSVMAQIKSKFSIDGGQVVAKDGDNILAGADGNLTVSEFVASQPEIFKIQSSGGFAKGNDTTVPQTKTMNSQAKIKSGLASLMK